MIFLIHYDPGSGGRLIRMIEFQSSERDAAATERLKIEVELLSSGSRMEVVTLEADSLDELKKSHSRYFKSIGEMAHDARSSNSDERIAPPPEKNRS